MSVMLRGSMRIAALVTRWGRELVMLVMMGVPQAMASKTGRPNPSENEGKRKVVAPR